MKRSPDKPVLVIDGSRFDDFEGFQREFSALLDDWSWNGNLDAFNDILRGGFGTPDEGFVLRWTDAERSRRILGWDLTIARLEEALERCDPSNRPHVAEALERARRHEGQTLFDTLVEIIADHGPGGRQARDGVTLELV
jgi:RNAse (barnase) inhibitor barstar